MREQSYDGPRPDTAHMVTVTIGAKGHGKRRQTIFVANATPDAHAMKALAASLNLEIEIDVREAQVCDGDPNEPIEALLDLAAAAIHGTVIGAKVDPVKARMNELEHEARENRRAIARLAGLVERLVTPTAPAVTGSRVDPVLVTRAHVVEHEEIGAPDLGTDAEPRTIGQAMTPDGRAIEVTEIRQGAPRDTRRRRGELRTEAGTPDMNLVGAIPKSDMFTVGEDGEIEVVKLPTVGDSLKSMAWLSDIPAKK